VMDDAEVGEQAVVAACAFVPVGMQVAPRSMVAGIPARLKRALGPGDVEWNAEATRAYHDLTGRCLASLRETQPLPRVEPDRLRLPATKVDALIQARDRGTGAA
jgi:phenylacetic acid degradation protein